MPVPAPYTEADFANSPFVAFYEVTRACGLVCKHCRACAQPIAHKNELNTEASLRLLDQFASFPKPPTLVFTGGDPMTRADIFQLVRHANEIGLVTAMTPSATSLVTKDALIGLKEAGLSRLAVSLDSSDPIIHDDFRGVDGSFVRTLEIMRDAREIGLSLQVNTTITRRNVDDVDAMAEMLGTLGVVMWSVFFLIPVGRGLMEERIPAERYEELFEKLWVHARSKPYGIKTTEAHHYRRFVLERMGDPLTAGKGGNTARPDRVQRAPLGVNDGRGVMFVSHTGRVQPSGFLPVVCGVYPDKSIVDIYQHSETMVRLRDKSLLRGKCGLCEYKSVCGGSRARAYAVSRDILGSEPDCIYLPQLLRKLEPCLA
jgi:radical SAM protein